MEQLLWLYSLPDDPLFCFDERPCFLIGDVIATSILQTGQVRKEHYAYEKLGSCALLAALQPLTGYRLGQEHAQRTRSIHCSCRLWQQIFQMQSNCGWCRIISIHTMSALSKNIFQPMKPGHWQSVLSFTTHPSQPVGSR